MELKITKKEEKPLLSREECAAEFTNASTPSNAELRKLLAEKLKKDEGLILIKRINQKFGTHAMTINFYAYHNADALKKFERFGKPKKQMEAK